MNKHQSLLLEMIYRLCNIDNLDLSIGDSKYMLSNMIAKYSNSGKIFLSQLTKDTLEEKNISINENVKYYSQFYGKKCSFYKKYKIQFIVDHVIPCGVILSHILNSDKQKQTIEKILNSNKVVMLHKQEDLLLHNIGYGKKTSDDFDIELNIWGRYQLANINVTDCFLINSGRVFR